MKRKAINFGFIITAIIMTTVFSFSCGNGGNLGTFEKPKDIVPYEEIISVYNVKIIGDIPEEEVQEIFTILKELPSDSDLRKTPCYWNVRLQEMEIERTENGVTNIEMEEKTGRHGWKSILEVKRNWLGRWVLQDSEFWLVDYIE